MSTAVLTAFVIIPFASTPAAAYPVKGEELTANSLYDTGPVEATSCREPSVRPFDIARAKAYVRAVHACTDRMWRKHFKAAGLPYSSPKVTFITRKNARFCGEKWDAVGVYCAKTRTYAVSLLRDTMTEPDDLYLMNVIAHEFGHHVQELTGLADAYVEEPYRHKKEMLEQNRRHELQAECLSGVVIGGLWDSLDRSSADWRDLLAIAADSGDDATSDRTHGADRNVRYWLGRGFRAASPEACNTWTAPSSRVA
ncbi:neutral zinc metallopeptidase [Nonomuraea longicatena]|uniref:Metalloprotease n=1 Tax=Nonomuraea longicatena TaxID=83682 RepID=A0ABN1NNN9_9ACTN